MSTPLVSVVIPTCGRPQYLPRAVASALSCQGDSVEVIVVPNGPDTSWKQALARWDGDPRVRVLPIAIAHGNVARNHGMSLVRGKYVRFLDDDDYLLLAAAGQIVQLEKSDADVCSGLVRNIDEGGHLNCLVGFPETRDFVCAAVSVSGFTLPVGNLYKRRAIQGHRWDESVARAQDNAWMIDLAAAREWDWVHCGQPVGVWFQHPSVRTSSTQRLRSTETAIIGRLTLLYKRLAAEDRLSRERCTAIANGLWYYVHRGFPSHPFYWAHVGREARSIDPLSRPPDSFYREGLFRTMSPVTGEWLLLPVRRVKWLLDDFPLRRRERDYRRIL